MKKKLCLFLLCLTFLGCEKPEVGRSGLYGLVYYKITSFLAYGKQEVIDAYQLQERNGIYYKINEEKGFTGTGIFKDENGQLKVEYNYKNGQLDGTYKSYYENGQLKVEGNLKNGLQDGLVKRYYENGQLRHEENYKNGEFEGPYKDYYENGQLRSKGNYKNGKLEGLFKIYYDNGQLEQEYNYKDGKLEGPYKDYYENGQVKEEENYENGQKDETGRSYYPSGRIKTYYYFDVSENYEDEPLDFKALMELCKKIEELIKNSDGDHVWEFGEYLIPLLKGYSYSNNLTTKEVMELNLLEAETNRIIETYFKE
ncbi:MAG: toxin-antitoxin system YwqK family antitoxin [Fusobacteriaceae bacterium]